MQQSHTQIENFRNPAREYLTNKENIFWYMLNEIELLKTDIAILWLKRIPPVNNHLISKENIFPGVGSSEETDSIGI